LIKALAKGKDGGAIVILGLSRRNTELLLADKPIRVDLTEFGFPGACVWLIAGETEATLLAQLRERMGDAEIG
jgi:hypothetical protein